MLKRTWDVFHSHALDRYKIYVYFVVAHSLPEQIISVLSIANVFREERFFLDNFVYDLDTHLTTYSRHSWDGTVSDSEPDVGVFSGLDWNGYYYQEYSDDTITIRENPYLEV